MSIKSVAQALAVIAVAVAITLGTRLVLQHTQQQDQRLADLDKRMHELAARPAPESSAPPALQPVPPPPTVVETTSAKDFGLFSASPTIDEITSPDGAWIANVRALGRTPYSRGTTFWLEFISQTGKPNRLFYLDWFERPADARLQPSPIGWSQDGQSIYLAWSKIPDAATNDTGSYAFMNQREVLRLDLNNDRASWVQVNPYHGSYPQDRSGMLLDIIPRHDVGLWVEAPLSQAYLDARDGKGARSTITTTSSHLIVFSLADKQPMYTIADISAQHGITITSATIDETGNDALYVTHRTKQNDELFYVDATTTSSHLSQKIDLRRFASTLRRHGVTSPYTIEIEKTALTNKNDFFLIFTGANGKRVSERWMRSQGIESLGKD